MTWKIWLVLGVVSILCGMLSSHFQRVVDGVLRGTRLTNVPTTSAYPMINFWGTNSMSWGGLATAGTRQLKVTNFQFMP